FDQTGAGARLQLQCNRKIFGCENYFLTGASFDWAESYFSSGFYPAAMGANYNNILIPGFGFQAQFAVPGFNDFAGLYLTDTFSPTDWFHITGAMRYNYMQVQLGGYGVNPNGSIASTAALEDFQPITPAAGFTLQPLRAFGIVEPELRDLTFFFNYSESFRAPMPDELVGANPLNPVILPMAQIGDPSLSPVYAQTYESGFRGKLPQEINWNFAFYRTDLTNQLQFQQTGHSAAGFFANVADEQNQGVEVMLQGTHGKFSWFANWSFLEATFQNSLHLVNTIGPVSVQPGDRRGGLPEQMVKVGVSCQLTDRWQVSADFQYYSSSFLYGDYANIYPMVSGWEALNIQTYYNLTKWCQIYAFATNVMDLHYFNSGLISQNVFTGAPNGGTIEPFLNPGSPFGVWGGVRFQF
ncbi:TonB-dependent receptor domain-containing protein, partial [Methylacidimicrobium cyclopophantes]|uniref:TonB-dependent receptor domain-containing protein n=1 Tax=Methylacidimicrobium cyclopophantes TaxID=1041766 RepID=UPI0011594DFD